MLDFVARSITTAFVCPAKLSILPEALLPFIVGIEAEFTNVNVSAFDPLPVSVVICVKLSAPVMFPAFAAALAHDRDRAARLYSKSVNYIFLSLFQLLRVDFAIPSNSHNSEAFIYLD